jgi:hypothetical protein
VEIAFLGVSIINNHILFELSGMGPNLTCCIKSRAYAVEKHTVIASNLVHINERDTIFLGN